MTGSALAPATPARRRQSLWALVLLVPAPTVGSVFALQVPQTGGHWAGAAIYGLAKAWLLVFPLIWHRRMDGGDWSLSPARRGGFGVAAGLGLAISVAIFVAYGLVGHWVDTEGVRTVAATRGFATPLRYLALSIYFVFVNTLLEEYVWRWFVFRKCEVLLGGVGGVLGSAACFTLHHVFVLSAQVGWRVTILGSLAVFAGGAIWSWCYLRYRSVWPGYLSHAIVDLAILTIGWTILFG